MIILLNISRRSQEYKRRRLDDEKMDANGFFSATIESREIRQCSNISTQKYMRAKHVRTEK